MILTTGNARNGAFTLSKSNVVAFVVGGIAVALVVFLTLVLTKSLRGKGIDRA
jgi:hypothetical protein